MYTLMQSTYRFIACLLAALLLQQAALAGTYEIPWNQAKFNFNVDGAMEIDDPERNSSFDDDFDTNSGFMVEGTYLLTSLTERFLPQAADNIFGYGSYTTYDFRNGDNDADGFSLGLGYKRTVHDRGDSQIDPYIALGFAERNFTLSNDTIDMGGFETMFGVRAQPAIAPKAEVYAAGHYGYFGETDVGNAFSGFAVSSGYEADSVHSFGFKVGFAYRVLKHVDVTADYAWNEFDFEDITQINGSGSRSDAELEQDYIALGVRIRGLGDF